MTPRPAPREAEVFDVFRSPPADAVDMDRPEVDLVFTVGLSECGNVTLQSAPNVTAANFTRSQLAAGDVIFSHTRPGQSRVRRRVVAWAGSVIQYALILFYL